MTLRFFANEKLPCISECLVYKLNNNNDDVIAC